MTPNVINGYWICGEGEASPYIRKSFSLQNVPETALLNLCGLGWHELYVNGIKADDRVLAPVVTQFDKHISYIAYDVVRLLWEGVNAISVLLGNGWYNCKTQDVWNFSTAHWIDVPKLCCELLCDGEQVLCSDESWKTHPSPITGNELRNGETYDARHEVPGVLSVDFDDSSWKAARQVCPPGGMLIQEEVEPCKIMEILQPVSQTVLHNSTVFDFGKNLTGWCEIEVSGEAGTHVKILYSEMIRDNQDVDREYIGKFVNSGEFQTDCYYLKGIGIETWHPIFTYHGFRYAKVFVWGGKAKINAIRAHFVHNSFQKTGSFECSDTTLNRLQAITVQSYLSNFTGIPTDCPHREKNGWTGDAQLACETGLWNFSAGSAYRHYQRIVADTQRPSGQLSGIAPTSGWGYNWGSGPAWDICLFELAYQVYRFTGEQAMIVEHYDAMRQYVDYCAGMAHDHLVRFGLGDWCHSNANHMAPTELTSSAYYCYAARLLGQFAGLLGHSADQAEYAGLAAAIAQKINEKYARPDGNYAGGEWTALACMLYFSIAPEERRQSIADLLAQKVQQATCKADFGILGAKYTPRVLAEYGYVDIAFRLFTQPEFPGWGHWLAMGATTLWEDWSGESSRNHIMFGDLSAWMYEYLAGIRLDFAHPGFTHMRIQPLVPSSLEWVKAAHSCRYGIIEVDWKKSADSFHLNVTIPDSTSATVILPNGSIADILPGIHSFQSAL